MQLTNNATDTVWVRSADVSALPPAIVERIYHYSLDMLLAEHQHIPWQQVLHESQFVRLRGYLVLIPAALLQHPVLTATHIYIETHESSIIFIVRDERKHTQGLSGQHEEVEASDQRFLLRCQKFPQQPFFITTLYHACWFKN